LNGKALSVPADENGYAEVRRNWRAGDILQITIPLAVRTEAMPDDPAKVAFLYGPLVLAGDLGQVAVSQTVPYAADQAQNFHQPVADVPVLVTEDQNLTKAVSRINAQRLLFRLSSTQPHNVRLRPFNELFYNYYNVYSDVLSRSE
jgi:DUF1680 family protein